MFLKTIVQRYKTIKRKGSPRGAGETVPGRGKRTDTGRNKSAFIKKGKDNGKIIKCSVNREGVDNQRKTEDPMKEKTQIGKNKTNVRGEQRGEVINNDEGNVMGTCTENVEPCETLEFVDEAAGGESTNGKK